MPLLMYLRKVGDRGATNLATLELSGFSLWRLGCSKILMHLSDIQQEFFTVSHEKKSWNAHPRGHQVKYHIPALSIVVGDILYVSENKAEVGRLNSNGADDKIVSDAIIPGDRSTLPYLLGGDDVTVSRKCPDSLVVIVKIYMNKKS
ncbi:hypothetical protein H2200_002703 [Cladophialophora chaetospira]|uniref:Uncharacterized protein n=1 Tax=Cladophialophora chaetospira TaxID=386627 RepID=A0AA38XJG6_9EURO|nr:hypothetical protein H2200_002703 [Cladophialophora chaetospira]